MAELERQGVDMERFRHFAGESGFPRTSYYRQGGKWIARDDETGAVLRTGESLKDVIPEIIELPVGPEGPEETLRRYLLEKGQKGEP